MLEWTGAPNSLNDGKIGWRLVRVSSPNCHSLRTGFAISGLHPCWPGMRFLAQWGCHILARGETLGAATYISHGQGERQYHPMSLAAARKRRGWFPAWSVAGEWPGVTLAGLFPLAKQPRACAAGLVCDRPYRTEDREPGKGGLCVSFRLIPKRVTTMIPLYRVESSSLMAMEITEMRILGSPQYPLHHLRRDDAGGFLVEALEAEGEAVVIHAEAVEDGGVEVADVDGVLDDVVGVVVC